MVTEKCENEITEVEAKRGIPERPSAQSWLDTIKSAGLADSRIGMYLLHNGVVRGTTRDGGAVSGMELSWDRELLDRVVRQIKARPGIFAVRVWINEGTLSVGDDIMWVLVAGDYRDNVFAGMQELVGLIKSEVVTEREASGSHSV